MALRLKVCRLDEVPRGEVRTFAVEGLAVPVLVGNLGGRYLATSGMCPHEDVELAGGDLEGCRIVCPGHGYQFDLVTGRCSHDPDLHLPTYAVTTDGEHLYVEIISNQPRRT
jgi:nitrite reductase/ring-hydroxylating ferredoxin subunit